MESRGLLFPQTSPRCFEGSSPPRALQKPKGEGQGLPRAESSLVSQHGTFPSPPDPDASVGAIEHFSPKHNVTHTYLLQQPGRGRRGDSGAARTRLRRSYFLFRDEGGGGPARWCLSRMTVPGTQSCSSDRPSGQTSSQMESLMCEVTLSSSGTSLHMGRRRRQQI